MCLYVVGDVNVKVVELYVKKWTNPYNTIECLITLIQHVLTNGNN